MKIKIKWGVLSTATIAVKHVIPAMLKSEYCEIIGIASRNKNKSGKIAKQFDIPSFYDDYQKLLDNKDIEAVYIPLPNHLHVAWAIKALQAGKHVLVEKPIALSSSDAEKLLKASLKYRNLKIMEAFMYKYHPQWIKVKKMINKGDIGELKTIQSSFSFFDDDAKSIVNKKEFGGGSLMDIGCYPISLSRFLFDAEPKSVMAQIKYDPKFKVDILSTVILDFDRGSSSFFSATQLIENQEVHIFGTKGSIKFETPFNPPPNKPVKIWLIRDDVKKEYEFERCDQYTLQADDFSLAILEDHKVRTDLKDAVNNMIIIEKIIESNKQEKRIYL
ncbi:Gfo/Idh/MocA family oxidoreductase [Flavobacteriaceae bacterium AH-315-O20]|nr:Gfo/Idh/MocA family oxidoreductase [Flavobacteriaceae bacterium AH-315-O20]